MTNKVVLYLGRIILSDDLNLIPSFLLFTNLRDSSIHTMFMRFEIDVYFIDENKRVFEKASLKPWRFYKAKKQAKYVLETKKGLLKIKIGDYLDFI